jgi:hypothetical protein
VAEDDKGDPFIKTIGSPFGDSSEVDEMASEIAGAMYAALDGLPSDIAVRITLANFIDVARHLQRHHGTSTDDICRATEHNLRLNLEGAEEYGNKNSRN